MHIAHFAFEMRTTTRACLARPASRRWHSKLSSTPAPVDWISRIFSNHVPPLLLFSPSPSASARLISGFRNPPGPALVQDVYDRIQDI